MIILISGILPGNWLPFHPQCSQWIICNSQFYRDNVSQRMKQLLYQRNTESMGKLWLDDVQKQSACCPPLIPHVVLDFSRKVNNRSACKCSVWVVGCRRRWGMCLLSWKVHRHIQREKPQVNVQIRLWGWQSCCCPSPASRQSLFFSFISSLPISLFCPLTNLSFPKCLLITFLPLVLSLWLFPDCFALSSSQLRLFHSLFFFVCFQLCRDSRVAIPHIPSAPLSSCPVLCEISCVSFHV